MKINHVIETPEGQVVIQGTLEAEEHKLVLGVGLNYLYQQGAIPFITPEKLESHNVVEGSDALN